MLKDDLKKAGINNKQVSVRQNNYSIKVEIKDLSVNFNLVEELANKYKSIAYDEFNGEILQGGNTFVFVDYDYYVKEKAIEDLKELSNKYIKLINNSSTLGINLSKGICIFYDQEDKCFRLHRQGFNNRVFYTMESLLFDAIYKYKLTLN